MHVDWLPITLINSETYECEASECRRCDEKGDYELNDEASEMEAAPRDGYDVAQLEIRRTATDAKRSKAATELSEVAVRSNCNETAFFYHI